MMMCRIWWLISIRNDGSGEAALFVAVIILSFFR